MKINRGNKMTADDMITVFEAKLSSLNDNIIQSSRDVTCANDMDWLTSQINWEDWTEEDYEQIWEKVDRKQVSDADGFYTDYTLWYNVLTDEWCTVFGDNDLYHPWDSDHDMDFEDNEDEARSWFEDYTGFDEEEDYD